MYRCLKDGIMPNCPIDNIGLILSEDELMNPLPRKKLACRNYNEVSFTERFSV